MSSDRSGDWQLWQYNFTSRELTQLTTNGGSFGYVNNNGVLFSKDHSSGIYQLIDGVEHKLIDSLQQEDWGNWIAFDHGIYFVKRDEFNDHIVYFSFDTEEFKLIASFNKNEIKRNRSLIIENNEFYMTLVGAHSPGIRGQGSSTEFIRMPNVHTVGKSLCLV